MKIFLKIVIFLCLLSCQKESISPTVFSIDPLIKKYYLGFLKEANIRGIKIDSINLIMKFNTKSSGINCGVCAQRIGDLDYQRKIEINDAGLCWKDAFEQMREALVFHELGHCLLERAHKDDKFTNGSYKSLMSTTDNDHYSPCLYSIDGSNSCNLTARRAYYIDELFNPSTPAPDWAK